MSAEAATRTGARIVLRAGREDDVEQFWKLDQECFTAGIAYSRKEFESLLRRQGMFAIVAEAAADRAHSEADEHSGGARPAMAGFVFAGLDRKALGRIVTLEVAPQRRRHGIASRLLLEAEQRLRALGATGVALEVAVDNAAALALYHRRGYRVLRRIRCYYNSELDALLLVKPFASSTAT
jgi:ribosomal protein S18 acetylase RimI-like enzyme